MSDVVEIVAMLVFIVSALVVMMMAMRDRIWCAWVAMVAFLTSFVVLLVARFT